MDDVRLGADDLAYVRRAYVTLGEACRGRCDLESARALVRARRLPAPSYREHDGTERVPADYFALVDEAGGVDGLHAHFVARYLAAARGAGVTASLAEAEEEWRGYLDGAYGVCLKRVTPEGIFEKEALVRSIQAMLDAPSPADAAWRATLRARVDRLDELERPFAPCDRIRFGGSVSRDRLIDTPRARYPEIFAVKSGAAYG